MKPTLVIGDVHGHFDRLEALLMQEGILDHCPDCAGHGDSFMDDDKPIEMCEACDGDGVRRVNHDVDVIQLGDLGHFGHDASPTGDEMCYKYADRWLDLVLWGNHDRAVVDHGHAFSGFMSPSKTAVHYMTLLANAGKYKLAHECQGFLLTHAGLHAAFKQQADVEFDRTDPALVADWINEGEWWPENDGKYSLGYNLDLGRSVLEEVKPHPSTPVRDAISRTRGGPSPFGGILWRDRREKLFDAFPQIFGHSADRDGLVRRLNALDIDPDGKHWCVDIGGKYEARLAGVWLIDGQVDRIARIDL